MLVLPQGVSDFTQELVADLQVSACSTTQLAGSYYLEKALSVITLQVLPQNGWSTWARLLTGSCGCCSVLSSDVTSCDIAVFFFFKSVRSYMRAFETWLNHSFGTCCAAQHGTRCSYSDLKHKTTVPMQTASDAEVVKTNHAFNVVKGCCKLA